MTLNTRGRAMQWMAIAVFLFLGACFPLSPQKIVQSLQPTLDPAVLATAVAVVHGQLTVTAEAANTATPLPTLTPSPSPTTLVLALSSPTSILPTLPAPASLGGAAYPTPAPNTGMNSPQMGSNPQSTWSYWENRNAGIGGPSSYSPLTYWRYAPQNWGKIPGYEICSQGKLQSPIDIPATENTAGSQVKVAFHYQPADLTLTSNDYTFQADVPSGSYLVLDNARYELLSFTFHSPAEHKIGGAAFDFEIQLLHQNTSGQAVIVSVLLRKGSPLPALTPLLANMPPPPFNQRSLAAFDPTGLLPPAGTAYIYTGSLTTPPCVEGINWVVFAAPLSIDAAQLAAYQSAFPENARPVQPLNQRPLVSGSAGH